MRVISILIQHLPLDGVARDYGLMAYFIEQKRGQYSSFFDIGTGSGILSVIASRNGKRLILY